MHKYVQAKECSCTGTFKQRYFQAEVRSCTGHTRHDAEGKVSAQPFKKLLECSSQVWLLHSGEDIKGQMDAGAGTDVQWGFDNVF
jgi:hypothetical protein